jgi:CDP-glucose 4,6-dehydratase
VEGLALSFWTGKRVLVTGHTGFKGSWLCLWMLRSGAHVTGFALPSTTTPSLFDQLRLADDLDNRIGDIRDANLVASLVSDIQPDVIFHLAAEAIVLRSYRDPVTTWQTNVMGTVHILEALRSLDKPCAAVLITSDKVYENQEWDYGYRECDHLGGHDPYSASKAAAELAISCWRRSYLNESSPIRMASARAGNVIGGGDWAENRIIPDLVRALIQKSPLKVRHPDAVRPWQHVLEPLSGYILLAQQLSENNEQDHGDAFNFGPRPGAERSVRDLVDEALRHWPGTWEDISDPDRRHEAGRLALSTERARVRLSWEPRWSFGRAVRETMAWYRASVGASPEDLHDLALSTIRDYENIPALDNHH